MIPLKTTENQRHLYNNYEADWFTTNGDVFPTGSTTMDPFPPVAPNGKRSFPSKNLNWNDTSIGLRIFPRDLDAWLGDPSAIAFRTFGWLSQFVCSKSKVALAALCWSDQGLIGGVPKTFEKVLQVFRRRLPLLFRDARDFINGHLAIEEQRYQVFSKHEGDLAVLSVW